MVKTVKVNRLIRELRTYCMYHQVHYDAHSNKSFRCYCKLNDSEELGREPRCCTKQGYEVYRACTKETCPLINKIL